jgi:hypothetical protein
LLQMLNIELHSVCSSRVRVVAKQIATTEPTPINITLSIRYNFLLRSKKNLFKKLS